MVKQICYTATTRLFCMAYKLPSGIYLISKVFPSAATHLGVYNWVLLGSQLNILLILADTEW